MNLATVLVVLAPLAGWSDVQIVYSRNSSTVDVVEDTVNFPTYGNVTADKVCVTADRQTLKAEIPAHTDRNCVASHVDHSDSTHPVTVCDQWQSVSVPALELATSVNYQRSVCLKTEYKDNESGYPVPVCVQSGTEAATYKLTYTLKSYEPSDYYRSSPTETVQQVRTCN